MRTNLFRFSFIAIVLAAAYWIDALTDQRDSAQAERDAWADSTRQITATAQARMAELVTARELNQRIGAELADALKRVNAKPTSIVRTVIEARTETLTVALRDTIVGSTPQWTFAERFGRYSASGAVSPATRSLSMAILADPIALSVVLARTAKGNIIGVVDSPDTTLRITLDVQAVQPDRPTWLERHDGKIGLVIGGLVGVLMKSL